MNSIQTALVEAIQKIQGIPVILDPTDPKVPVFVDQLEGVVFLLQGLLNGPAVNMKTMPLSP